MIDRRRFLATAAALPIALWARPVLAAPRWDRTLVLVELHGGNDGLNTVVPYTDPLYRRLRPRLALPRDRVLPLDDRLGLHAALEPLMDLWRKKDLAIALGVGYPEPNLSHFRSIEIWDTGSDSETVLDAGWIARLFAQTPPPRDLPADGVVLGRDSPGPLFGGGIRTVALKSPKAFLKQAARAGTTPATGHSNPALDHVLGVQAQLKRTAHAIREADLQQVRLGTTFPKTPLGRQLETAARMLASGLRVPAIKVALGGFDTHAGQAPAHARLLGQLAEALAAFAKAMESRGLWDSVLVMTYSEFGRRTKENGSAGTDHGTAAPHFLLGGRVRGGFYGAQPPLDDLRKSNLKHRLHYRRLYATVAREWWKLDAGAYPEKPLGLIG